MLNFLGTGGAFAFDLGNNSAYYKKDGMFLLIDCGETTMQKLYFSDILDDVHTVNILITHTHSDHVGSLGSFIFHCSGKNIPTVNVIYPNVEVMKTLCELFGTLSRVTNFLTPEQVSDFPIKEYKNLHEKMEAYGYLMELDGKKVYYSGDSKSIHQELVDMLINGEIDYFYQDLREKENPFHLSFGEIEKLIPEEFRSKVICMHFDKSSDIPVIESMGYSTVKSI